MANISIFSRLVNGVQRQVDLSTNTLVVQAIQINGTLLSSSTAGSAGSKLVGDDNSYTNFTPATPTVKGALSAIDAALTGSGSSQFDGTFKIQNTASPTKVLNFSAANITAGQTRTITMADANVNLALVLSAIQANGSVPFTANQPMGGFLLTGLAAGSAAGQSVRYEQAILVNGVNAFTASQSMGGFNLTNLANGVNPQDAVTLSQTQALLNGLSWKNYVRSATTAALPANTYSNGSSGVGATLTGTTNAALTAQDGVTLVVNDRLLVKNEAAAANNGIYVVTQVGSASLPYILTRATDSNTAANLASEAVQVGPEATVQAGNAFRLNTDSIVVGTTALNYVNWATGIAYAFANGLTVSGATVSVLANPTLPSIVVSASGVAVNLNAAGAISSSATGLQINLAATNPSLAITANALDVKISPTGALLASSTGLGVSTDGTSIQISADQLRVAAGTFDQKTILGGSGAAASVAYAPQVASVELAGQSFSANTTYAVRYGIVANGETAGSVYAADITTSSFDLFQVIGLISVTTAITAGGNVTVVTGGQIAVQSSDAAFSSGDQGKAFYLQAGGVNATTTAPTTSGSAVVKLGVVKTTGFLKVQIGTPFVA